MTTSGFLEFGSALDAAALAEKFRQSGHVRIGNFLSPAAAERMHEELRLRQDWKQLINNGNKVFELDRETRETFSADQTARLDAAVYSGAADKFQYRYETIRSPDEAEERETSSDVLAQFATWMSRGKARNLFREIIASPAIQFADCQATCYSSGDFLTGHDDAVAGKNRFAAYVLSLNPVWRIEWGGLLLMHRNSQSVEGFSPAFNTLDIFSVGTMHSVSEVSKAAPCSRLSITGWLRGR